MIAVNSPTPGLTLGSKASHLFRLVELGLKVPPFIVIPAEFALKINSGSEPEIFMHYQFTPEEISAINQLLPPGEFFAVRSSAQAEDLDYASHAGQYATFLYIPREELLQRVKDVWLSAYSPQLKAYRLALGITDEKPPAVIIQAMVNAQVSGVGFGINPVSGNRRQKVINTVYGLGEGLVSGELNADHFVLENGQTIEKKIAVKERKLVFSSIEGKGAAYQAVKSAESGVPSLNDSQLHQIEQVLSKLHVHFKKPQDIEFALENNELFLLQTRPVTTLGHMPDTSSEFVIWDNSNIIESYPGLTSPLTFSFILPVYETVYRQLARLLGVSEKDIDSNSKVFANMLGLLKGRVYYNLLNWYRSLALLPGYSLNAELMEKMMGVKQRFELRNLPQRSKMTERLRVLRTILILIRNLWALPFMKRKFTRDFNARVKAFKMVPLAQLDAHQLMALYHDFETTLIKKWKAPLVNDFFAMIYFGLLQKTTQSWKNPGNNLHNDLIMGSHDIISIKPMLACLELRDTICADSEMKDLFLRNSAPQLAVHYRNGKLKTTVSKLIDRYLEEFGDRCLGELKLETVTYRQDPSQLMTILKSYVQQNVTSPDNFNIQRARREAEAAARKELRGKPFKNLIFRHLLKQARTMVSDRENLRFERTRAFGVIRQIFCEIGDRLYSEGLLDSSRDIFLLTKQEIFSFILGTSAFDHPRNLINLRKRDFERYSAAQLPERISTYGMVYAGNTFTQNEEAPVQEGQLKGIGCCAGVVRGKVRVVHSPSEVGDLNGDILVTGSTDPGWITLFPTAGAILVERGSLLSHSAIVSREMGKPCIVGITGLLSRLKTGDEVQMNGQTGEILILSEQHE